MQPCETWPMTAFSTVCSRETRWPPIGDHDGEEGALKRRGRSEGRSVDGRLLVLRLEHGSAGDVVLGTCRSQTTCLKLGPNSGGGRELDLRTAHPSRHVSLAFTPLATAA